MALIIGVVAGCLCLVLIIAVIVVRRRGHKRSVVGKAGVDNDVVPITLNPLYLAGSYGPSESTQHVTPTLTPNVLYHQSSNYVTPTLTPNALYHNPRHQPDQPQGTPDPTLTSNPLYQSSDLPHTSSAGEYSVPMTVNAVYSQPNTDDSSNAGSYAPYLPPVKYQLVPDGDLIQQTTT